VWEKTVHARLLHRRIENNFGLPVFVRHRVVVFDGYAAKGLALRGQTISKHGIVRAIRDSQQAHASQERSQGDSPEPWVGLVAAGFAVFDCGHGPIISVRELVRGRSVDNSSQKTRPDLLSRASKGCGTDVKIHQKPQVRAVVPRRFEECK